MLAPVQVFYCGICTAPPEYCEFGPSLKRCKVWLQENKPELFARLYADAGAAEAAAKLKDLTVTEGSETATAEGVKTEGGEGKAAAKPAAPEKLDALQKEELKKEKKKAGARVSIKRIERTKRKCVIAVSGLEVFDVDLKKTAKLFATKFACGSSVTKNPAGFDEIIVQGDVQDDIYELIIKTFKNIPEDNIDMD
ncbi:density-regulated protein DRP1 [Rhizoclosmatium globosum]|uniref:Translation machinery-associated protein 22 n=1 Tax=Rhizoclosmatium globosum TaxID=329046 RepID=A0A1Y2C9X7_9FUNG|nr:density-regulated protein DRP1 [Rhizoclosmatium globosum]|eukprot:ORY43842.1 density-regulated protein DRP1 [Rhizoclosmatium globosum]